MTAREAIILRLSESLEPLPLHALDIPMVSQTSASARLRELARIGVVESVRVPGKRFTAWRLIPRDPVLPLEIR